MSFNHPSYLLIIAAILATSSHGAYLCQQDQSASLLRLKSGFMVFEAPNLPSWKPNTDCCTWEGVRCDAMTGHVTVLDLSNLALAGNLSSAIFNLTSLRILNLANNFFVGQSPWLTRGFEQLPHLEYLNLSDSCLPGNIPVENGQLANLVTLDLSGWFNNLILDTLIDNLGSLQKLYLNNVKISVSPVRLAHSGSTNTTSGIQELSMQLSTITGRIEPVLSNLRSLSKLTLHYSSFSTPITVPEAFAGFSSLEVLSLRYCNLIGVFPSTVFHIRSLRILDLSGNYNLAGELPEFTQGGALEHLIIGSTNFSGKIPASASNLHNLSILDLSYCQFHGHIPSFAQWPNIKLVDLSRNNLTGSLPSNGYLDLHNLTHLNLESNMLSGEIPAHLFSHHSLQLLLLSKNSFTGNFRLYHNLSSNMIQISVNDNKLQGPIPKLLSKFVGLQILDLSSNNFTGTIDLSLIKNYVNMSYLSLSNNRLSVLETDDNHSFTEYPSIKTLELASCNISNVPRFLMHQRGIEILDLSNNNIVGHIPDWIWGIGHSVTYNLSHNLFTGVQINLPSCLSLDLHSNKIEGTLPITPKRIYYLDYSNNHFNSSVTTEFWTNIGSTNILLLSNNSLTGEVQHSLCNATDILVLDLSFNSFSGSIPPCLLEDNNILEILNLRGNSFHGPLPQNISKECALKAVDLNGNKLEGKLPVSLVNCHMLQVLDLGNNQIVDTFPEWLGVLPLLKVLVLRSNKFHGHIDHSYWKDKQMHSTFEALHVLDLSSNDFRGTIPTTFLKKLKAMMAVSFESPKVHADTFSLFKPLYKNLVTVVQKGLELTLVNILSVFTTIDLSNNNFEGIISDEFGSLKSLKGLNLSRNLLGGEIPPPDREHAAARVTGSLLQPALWGDPSHDGTTVFPRGPQPILQPPVGTDTTV